MFHINEHNVIKKKEELAIATTHAQRLDKHFDGFLPNGYMKLKISAKKNKSAADTRLFCW